MEDLQDKIIEVMDLFDDEQVTTADKIDSPERALEKQAIDDFMKRNPMAGGGMLVQPSADGSRPGYADDKLNIENVSKLRKEGNTADEAAKKLKVTKSAYEVFVTKNKNKLPDVAKGSPIKSLDKEKQKIYDLLSQDKLPKVKGSDPSKRFRNKKWEELDNTARANFNQRIFPYYKDLLSKTKGMITEDDLVKLLSERFGEDVKVATIRGVSRTTKPGQTTALYSTRFSKEILKLLKPYNYTKKQKFYKIPTETDIRKLKNKFELRFSQTDTLRPNTVKNISILHDKFKDTFKKGILPDLTDVLEKLPKGTTPSQAGNATIRLAQIYAGKKFDLTFKGIDKKFANKINGIKINNPTSKKMFEQISKLKFGDPYLDQLYRINLQMIDEKLGNKIGTFENLKDQAKSILKKNKIPIYDGRVENPFGFNINEIVGVSGSAPSKAAEFSQFIDVMEGNLNQNILTGYQSQLSKARSKIEANPSLFETESKKINARALELEKEYGVKLAKLRPAEDVTKYFSPARLRELSAQGLDIADASKRAGYTFELPKSAVTIEEFVKQTPKAVRGLSAFMKTNFPELKCSLSKGVNCNDPQAYQRAINEYSQKAAQGDEAAKATLSKFSNKVATAGKFIKGALGPLALATEVAVDLAIPLNTTLQEGIPYKQAFANTLINKYILGPKLQVDKEAEIAKEMAKGEEFAMAERGRRMFLPQSATADAQRLKKREEEMKALYPQLDMVNLSNKEIDQLLAAQGVYSPFTLGFGMQQRQPGIGDMRYNEDVAYDEIRDIFNKGAEEDMRRQQMQSIADAGGVANLAKGGRAGFKSGTLRKGILKLIDDSVKSTPKDTTSELDKLIKKTLDEDLFDKKDRIVDSINISEAKKRRNYPYNMQVFEEPKNLDFYDAITKSNFRTKTGPYFDRIRRRNKAGGGLLKQAGDRSGPPPESGPNPQGLQGLMKRGIKT